MSDTREVQVDCRGREAKVEIVGEGPDVVFVGTAAPMMWSRSTARALAGHGYTVTNFDYGSAADEPEPRSALDQVADVVAVMDALGVEAAALVGLSRGAITAFAAAARNPDRVTGLVLAFPVAGFADTIHVHQPVPEPEPDEDDETFMLRSLASVFSAGFLRSNLDDAIALVTSPPGEVIRLERAEEAPFPEGMAVVCGTLIIEGGADEVVSPVHPARYVKEIAGAEHVVVPDASHGWLMEQPDEFARIVAGFLSSGRAGPRQGV